MYREASKRMKYMLRAQRNLYLQLKKETQQQNNEDDEKKNARYNNKRINGRRRRKHQPTKWKEETRRIRSSKISRRRRKTNEKKETIAIRNILFFNASSVYSFELRKFTHHDLSITFTCNKCFVCAKPHSKDDEPSSKWNSDWTKKKLL